MVPCVILSGAQRSRRILGHFALVIGVGRLRILRLRAAVSGCAGPSPPWRRLPSPTDSPPGCPLNGSVLRMTKHQRHPERSVAESKDPSALCIGHWCTSLRILRCAQDDWGGPLRTMAGILAERRATGFLRQVFLIRFRACRGARMRNHDLNWSYLIVFCDESGRIWKEQGVLAMRHAVRR